MKKRTNTLFLCVLALFAISLFSGSLGFAEPVEKRVDMLEQVNQELRDRVEKMEKDSTAPTTPETFTQKDRESLELLKAIQKRVMPFGDLSFRYHGFSNLEDDVFSHGVDFSKIHNISTKPDARIRLGLKGEIVDGLSYMTRLATGNAAQPSSAWQSLNGFFTKKNINLDRFYLDWKPTFFKPMQAMIGKFENPTGGTQLVWDGDVGIQGFYLFLDAAPVAKSEFIQRLGLGAVLYYLDELTPNAADDVFVAGPTFQSKFGVAKNTALTFNATYYDYNNVDGVAQAQGLGTLIGAQGALNTSNLTPAGPVNIGSASTATLIGTGFASDFNLFNPYLELATSISDVPIKVFLDQVWNLGAAGAGADLDYGLKTGVKVGGTGKPGNPWVEYDFYHIEADATLDAFNEDEIGTNVISHYFIAGVTLAKNVDLYTTLNFTRDLDPFLRGFADNIGTQIPGIAVPIDENPWMLRSRLFLTTKF